MRLGAESGQRIEHSHRAFWMDMPLAAGHDALPYFPPIIL